MILVIAARGRFRDETDPPTAGTTCMIRSDVYIRRFRRLCLVPLALLAVACSGNRENINLLSPDDLYARGVAEFDDREFQRAIIYLERFLSTTLGDPRIPDARMLLGDAHVERREYATAASHYQRVVTDFPNHPRNREARFKICDAYYKLSPAAPLDQEYTVSAIAHCQSVAEYFPGTEEGDSAAGYVDDLRQKLAKKSYDAGMHYFRRRAYDAAVLYFQEVVTQYPDTPLAPSALEQLVETYGRLGYVEDAEEAKERLLREYPESPEAQAMRV